MLAQSTSTVTTGARRTKSQQISDYKRKQEEREDEKNGRVNQVRPETD